MTVCVPSSAPALHAGRKRLEVIVTSPEEAFAAELGGADRLEVVRSLDQGGLTPSLKTVQAILEVVRIPVRVMLRETDSMEILDADELDRLVELAHYISQLPVDGLVTGFVRSGAVDEYAVGRITNAAPRLRFTFHRAFEHLRAPLQSVATLKQFSQIDRILIRVTDDGSGIEMAQVKTWQHFAAPEIGFILGVGLGRTLLPVIRNEESLAEVHVGRGAREPENIYGAVNSEKVARLKSALS